MPKYNKIEVNRTEWEVPERYMQLQPVGSGSYGQVWYVKALLMSRRRVVYLLKQQVRIHLRQ